MHRRHHPRWTASLIALALVQGVCTLHFLASTYQMAFGIEALFGQWEPKLRAIPFTTVGLVLGPVLAWMALMQSRARMYSVEDQLDAHRTTFETHLEGMFADWHLTPAERDVALFLIKGFSTVEIAALRATAEGTVKAQSHSVFRKAGVSRRAQLVSLVIEDLMAGIGPGEVSREA